MDARYRPAKLYRLHRGSSLGLLDVYVSPVPEVLGVRVQLLVIVVGVLVMIVGFVIMTRPMPVLLGFTIRRAFRGDVSAIPEGWMRSTADRAAGRSWWRLVVQMVSGWLVMLAGLAIRTSV